MSTNDNKAGPSGVDNLVNTGENTGENVDNNAHNDDDNNICIDRVTSVRLPPFWRAKPKLWFVQVEGLMKRAKIVRDRVMLGELICHLEADLMSCIEDILEGPEEEQSYKRVKDRIIRRFSDTEEQKTRQLLQGLTLDDNKPSELLRRMRSLAGADLSEDFLKNMWVQRLPTATQQILTVNPGSLEAMAEQADRIADISAESSISVVSVPKKDSGLTLINKRMDEFAQILSQIQKKLNQRDTSRSRARTQSPASKSEPNQNAQMCYYHKRFGDRASKCKAPCSFPNAGN